MRQSLVAANWKMNGSIQSNQLLLDALKQGISKIPNTEVAVCPPFVYLQQIKEVLQGTAITWGAQNLSHEAPGAFTGEIAANMLLDFNCKYVIVGHSERRNLYGESDELVAKKFAGAQSVGLIPILCVGELLEERETGKTEPVVQRQLDAVIHLQGITALEQAVIAYEPVWAIGTGKTATPEQAQEVHAFIRQHLAKEDAKIAAKVQILYGGSVKGSNASELFAMPDIDGGLIGGASLKADEFLTICQATR
ncbi:triosephosphate isomerase [Thioploca ingrica]|uniref:Triosephosphate isomerase n=1 Tax=Thioploca ingrica TaxID=40754 RepID=A0A090AJP0_9GAMM|nr:triosephosphate isomerase [Thioploca ingrica]